MTRTLRSTFAIALALNAGLSMGLSAVAAPVTSKGWAEHAKPDLPDDIYG